MPLKAAPKLICYYGSRTAILAELLVSPKIVADDAGMYAISALQALDLYQPAFLTMSGLKSSWLSKCHFG
jgi:hypothetical protein